MIEYCGSGQSLLGHFHSKCLMFVDMNGLLQENLVCEKLRFANILWLAVEGLLLKDLAVDSLASSSTLKADGKGAGEGVAVLDASWYRKDEALTVGAGMC